MGPYRWLYNGTGGEELVMEFEINGVYIEQPRTGNARDLDTVDREKIQQVKDLQWETRVIRTGVSEGGKGDRINKNPRGR